MIKNEAAALAAHDEFTRRQGAQGGPAYPTEVDLNGDKYVAMGMTLRDYFAAAALPAIVTSASAGFHNPGADMPEEASMEMRMASDAYTLADAMLAERAKKESKP